MVPLRASGNWGAETAANRLGRRLPEQFRGSVSNLLDPSWCIRLMDSGTVDDGRAGQDLFAGRGAAKSHRRAPAGDLRTGAYRRAKLASAPSSPARGNQKSRRRAVAKKRKGEREGER